VCEPIVWGVAPFDASQRAHLHSKQELLFSGTVVTLGVLACDAPFSEVGGTFCDDSFLEEGFAVLFLTSRAVEGVGFGTKAPLDDEAPAGILPGAIFVLGGCLSWVGLGPV